MGIQKNILTQDVGDVEKTHIMHDTNVALVADIQMQESENILGSNGIPKWKN